jgi:(p)ppGpp synthase/HD superfamily hydrolase
LEITMTSFEDRVRLFVLEKYQSGFSNNGAPRIEHARAVVTVLYGLGVTNPITLGAAWLHDAVSDGITTLDALADGFNPRLADYVGKLTCRRGMPVNRYSRKVMSGTFEVKLVAFADLLVHLRETKRIRDGEKREAARARLQQIWAYYSTFASNVAPQLCELITTELRGRT